MATQEHPTRLIVQFNVQPNQTNLKAHEVNLELLIYEQDSLNFGHAMVAEAIRTKQALSRPRYWTNGMDDDPNENPGYSSKLLERNRAPMMPRTQAGIPNTTIAYAQDTSFAINGSTSDGQDDASTNPRHHKHRDVCNCE